MNKDNDFLAVLDADIQGALAAANSTPPPQPSKAPPPPSPAAKAAESFPLDVLPPRAVAYIEAAEYANGIPRDFMAAAILWAAATATGNAAHIELKAGTRYAPILFLALVGLPNSNKSQALRAALRPLFDADGLAYERYKTAQAEYEAAQGMGKAERHAAGLADAQRPMFSKTILSDVTPEALAGAHRGHPRGIGVYFDELASWFKRFDRYSNGAEAEMWLSLWIAALLAVDRKTAEPVYIESPFVGVCGTLQPSILERLAADDRGQNGFLDRILFSWPDGLTKPVWDDRGLDLTLRDAYTSAISRLLQLPFIDGAPAIITLAPDARRDLFAWYNGRNKSLCDNAANELLQGLHGKMDIHAARLILVLHLLRYAYTKANDLPTEIDAGTVADGIRLAEYFRAQSLRVHDRIFGADPVERLPSDRRKIYDALPDEKFTTADGLAIAAKHKMPPRTFKEWIKDRGLFEKIAHGLYAKCL